ncbi:BURP domain protein USPL1 [Capsicum galapagoense]
MSNYSCSSLFWGHFTLSLLFIYLRKVTEGLNRRIMDVTLSFCVLSLNLLILLVAYGIETRKMVEGDMQGKRLNFPLAQVRLSSYGDLKNKDDSPNIRIYNNRGDNNHQQAQEENAQVRLSSYGDLNIKDDTTDFWIYNNQGNTNHQQAQEEKAQVRISSSYGDLQNKDDTKDLRIYNTQVENNHQEAKENAHIHSSSHMDHIDPSLRVFFLTDDLKLRKEITISFPRRDLSSTPSFLPKEEADSIPFSLKELPNLLQRFSLSRNSLQAKGMEDTLRVCEAPPIKGETKYCATSAEAMLDFVQEIMGEKTQIKALSTTHFSNSTPLLQKYTILDAPHEVAAPKLVACHTMPYAYAIFYCHYTISKSKVFKVSLGGENGDRVEAIAVCHLDTSDWSPSHVSFQVLSLLPGTSPICHFFPSDNIVWVPNIATAQVI